MARRLRLTLRAVLYREDDRWVAHCLEFDVIGDGDTPEEAFRQLTQAIAIQVEHSASTGNRRNLFSPADGKLFEMFAAGKNVATGALELHDHLDIEGVEAREYSDEYSDDDLLCV